MGAQRLDIGTLDVESFGTLASGDVDGCVCDYPPCICTAGEDCVTGTSR